LPSFHALDFLTAYQDQSTMQPVENMRAIAAAYMFRSTFVFDVVAVFPFIY